MSTSQDSEDFMVLAINQLFHVRIEITIKRFKLNLSPWRQTHLFIECERIEETSSPTEKEK